MGTGLSSPVTSVVVRRRVSKNFRIGIAEMNGWRNSMEDAHVIITHDASWGFFGVCDGHGGDQCSKYIANRLAEELRSGPPIDDAATKALFLRLDAEYLNTGMPSGSTGTFALVTPPKKLGDRYGLRIANVGDSRVLLGRFDGTLVEGPGTDGSLTTDHKPDLPSEKERIVRNGATVQDARVNGLAVSRAFGDAQYKVTGGPSQEERPVCAVPELLTLECDKSDFLMLVCDGISEGNFPNRTVIKLAAEKLRANEDPGTVASAICHEALRCDSKDNLSCMIVLLGGEDDPPEESVELVPGPFELPINLSFRQAYATMASHAGLSLPEALVMRHDMLERRLNMMLEAAVEGPDNYRVSEQLAASRTELSQYDGAPKKDAGLDAEARVAWFAEWLQHNTASDGDALGMRSAPNVRRWTDEISRLCGDGMKMCDDDGKREIGGSL
eukprot:NODE_8581_length_1484_cov_9.201916.p1 GENE.NODE_8581_length_1484_cov_9.201916~~NODE_8581_length_1484_cov_9.201916.p1  ORF type:complete len:442 (+),score=125.17 NODE_8581_length_1484_cov_9.201916:86-1411(+)